MKVFTKFLNIQLPDKYMFKVIDKNTVLLYWMLGYKLILIK